MKSALTLIIILCTLFLPVSAAEPIYSVSDLSNDERLLLSITASQPGWGDFTSLFTVNLNNNDRLDTQTFFPEISHYFPDTGELEIQNRFGLYRVIPGDAAGIRELPFYPVFSRDGNLEYGRILPVSSSPDGKWVIKQEAVTAVRGKLVLYSQSGGDRLVISDNHVLNYRGTPALWSPDSRCFLYSKNGRIFYVSTLQLESGRLPDESFREIGEGTLANVKWTDSDALYYLKSKELHLVRPSELFTKSFYSDPLPSGGISGILPIEFDSNFDKFWPSSDGSSLIMLKESRYLFYFPLKAESEAINLPYMHLIRDAGITKLWWSPGGDVFFLSGGSLFILKPDGGNSFTDINIPDIIDIIPSPDSMNMALLKDSGVSILNLKTMEEHLYLEHPAPRNLFWIDTSHILIAGAYRIESVSLDGKEADLIALSQVDKAGFDSRESLMANSGENTYMWLSDSNSWVLSGKSETAVFRIPRYVSPEYRVFLNDNRITVRTVNGFGNRKLLELNGKDSRTDLSEENLNLDNRVLSHGSRTRGKTVSLVFNGVKDDTGIGELLRILADYSLHSTFFVGGDFIRRNPESTRLIADSGHELASLFYTHIDMTDLRYRIDKDFIVKGLGRNEDSFFQETGREVSTLWHAPWYVISPPILEATEEMDYFYIGRDIDPLDWVVLDGSSENMDLYRSSPDLVAQVLTEVKPGSIIPIRIGKPGKRNDYFFQKLDLLINGLLNDGYEIITVGELRDRMD